MKLKSEILKVVKKWFSDIADLRQKHKLVIVMRDNAGENKSQVIIDFFESVGVKNYFSTAHEQWQNGLAEAAINSIMMAARTIMAKSGLGSRFWFKAALEASDARNATYKDWHYSLAADAWQDARCFLIPCIWVQGMVLSRF